MDISNNSELLRYANSNANADDDDDVKNSVTNSNANADDDEDFNVSFIVVERETLDESPPMGSSPVNRNQSERLLVSEIAAASDPSDFISEIITSESSTQSFMTNSDGETIKKLSEENVVLRDEFRNQQGRMREVMEQLRVVVADSNRLREEDQLILDQSKTKIQNLSKENEELKAKVVELEEEIKSLQEKVTAFESAEFVTVDPLKDDQLACARKRIDELQDLLNLEKAQTDELKNLLREIQSKPTDEQEKVSIVELNKRLVAKDEEMLTLRAQLESSQLELEKLAAESASREALKNQAVSDKEAIVRHKLVLEANLRDIESQLESLKITLSESNEACLKYQDELQKLQSCSSPNVVLNSLNSKIAENEEQLQILKVRLESSQTALEDTKKELENARAENGELNQARERLLKELEELHVDRSASRKNNEQELNEIRKENRELKQKVMDRDASFAELNIAREKCEEVCAKYKEKIRLLSHELQVKSVDSGAASADSEAGSARVREVLSNLDRENAQLKTQIAALSTENESISHWKAQCDVYEADYQRACNEKSALETKLAEMSAELDEVKARDANQQKELTDLHQTHLRLAQEHVNGDPQENENVSSTDPRDGSDNSPARNGDFPGQVVNFFKRGMSLLWESSDTEEDDQSGSNSQPAAASNSNQNVPSAPPAFSTAPGSMLSNVSRNDDMNLPPCPVCSRVFYSYDNLVKHCERCGENNSVMSTVSGLGSHLDPFVYVPNQ